MNGTAVVTFATITSEKSVIELEVEWIEDVSVSTVSPFSIPRLVESWARLGSDGGFAGMSYRPSQSTVTLESSSVTEKRFDWRWVVAGCEPGAATALYHLMLFSHNQIAPLKRSEIRSSLSSGRGVPPVVTGYYRPVPFELDIDNESNDVALRIEGSSPFTKEQAQQIESLLMAWTYVTAAAGLSEHGEDTTRPLLIMEDDPEWRDDELSLMLSDAAFENTAFDALVNALHATHVRGVPIALLEIQ